mgnify:FL=1
MIRLRNMLLSMSFGIPYPFCQIHGRGSECGLLARYKSLRPHRTAFDGTETFRERKNRIETNAFRRAYGIPDDTLPAPARLKSLRPRIPK